MINYESVLTSTQKSFLWPFMSKPAARIVKCKTFNIDPLFQRYAFFNCLVFVREHNCKISTILFVHYIKFHEIEDGYIRIFYLVEFQGLNTD